MRTVVDAAQWVRPIDEQFPLLRSFLAFTRQLTQNRLYLQ
jgi:hypothetical protein